MPELSERKRQIIRQLSQMTDQMTPEQLGLFKQVQQKFGMTSDTSVSDAARARLEARAGVDLPDTMEGADLARTVRTAEEPPPRPRRGVLRSIGELQAAPIRGAAELVGVPTNPAEWVALPGNLKAAGDDFNQFIEDNPVTLLTPGGPAAAYAVRDVARAGAAGVQAGMDDPNPVTAPMNAVGAFGKEMGLQSVSDDMKAGFDAALEGDYYEAVRRGLEVLGAGASLVGSANPSRAARSLHTADTAAAAGRRFQKSGHGRVAEINDLQFGKFDVAKGVKENQVRASKGANVYIEDPKFGRHISHEGVRRDLAAAMDETGEKFKELEARHTNTPVSVQSVIDRAQRQLKEMQESGYEFTEIDRPWIDTLKKALKDLETLESGYSGQIPYGRILDRKQKWEKTINHAKKAAGETLPATQEVLEDLLRGEDGLRSLLNNVDDDIAATNRRFHELKSADTAIEESFERRQKISGNRLTDKFAWLLERRLVGVALGGGIAIGAAGPLSMAMALTAGGGILGAYVISKLRATPAWKSMSGRARTRLGKSMETGGIQQFLRDLEDLSGGAAAAGDDPDGPDGPGGGGGSGIPPETAQELVDEVADATAEGIKTGKFDPSKLTQNTPENQQTTATGETPTSTDARRPATTGAGTTPSSETPSAPATTKISSEAAEAIKTAKKELKALQKTQKRHEAGKVKKPKDGMTVPQRHKAIQEKQKEIRKMQREAKASAPVATEEPPTKADKRNALIEELNQQAEDKKSPAEKLMDEQAAARESDAVSADEPPARNPRPVNAPETSVLDDIEELDNHIALLDDQVFEYQKELRRLGDTPEADELLERKLAAEEMIEALKERRKSLSLDAAKNPDVGTLPPERPVIPENRVARPSRDVALPREGALEGSSIFPDRKAPRTVQTELSTEPMDKAFVRLVDEMPEDPNGEILKSTKLLERRLKEISKRRRNAVLRNPQRVADDIREAIAKVDKERMEARKPLIQQRQKAIEVGNKKKVDQIDKKLAEMPDQYTPDEVAALIGAYGDVLGVIHSDRLWSVVGDREGVRRKLNQHGQMDEIARKKGVGGAEDPNRERFEQLYIEHVMRRLHKGEQFKINSDTDALIKGEYIPTAYTQDGFLQETVDALMGRLWEKGSGVNLWQRLVDTRMGRDVPIDPETRASILIEESSEIKDLKKQIAKEKNKTNKKKLQRELEREKKRIKDRAAEKEKTSMELARSGEDQIARGELAESLAGTPGFSKSKAVWFVDDNGNSRLGQLISTSKPVKKAANPDAKNKKDAYAKKDKMWMVRTEEGVLHTIDPKDPKASMVDMELEDIEGHWATLEDADIEMAAQPVPPRFHKAYRRKNAAPLRDRDQHEEAVKEDKKEARRLKREETFFESVPEGVKIHGPIDVHGRYRVVGPDGTEVIAESRTAAHREAAKFGKTKKPVDLSERVKESKPITSPKTGMEVEYHSGDSDTAMRGRYHSKLEGKPGTIVDFDPPERTAKGDRVQMVRVEFEMPGSTPDKMETAQFDLPLHTLYEVGKTGKKKKGSGRKKKTAEEKLKAAEEREEKKRRRAERRRREKERKISEGMEMFSDDEPPTKRN